MAAEVASCAHRKTWPNSRTTNRSGGDNEFTHGILPAPPIQQRLVQESQPPEPLRWLLGETTAELRRRGAQAERRSART
jgi:hypothetical protein